MELPLIAYTKYVGLIAGAFTSLALLPPLIKLIKEKRPDNISIGMLVVLLGGLCFWIYYGLLKQDVPIIVTNSISLLQNVAMIGLRWKYKNSGK